MIWSTLTSSRPRLLRLAAVRPGGENGAGAASGARLAAPDPLRRGHTGAFERVTAVNCADRRPMARPGGWSSIGDEDDESATRGTTLRCREKEAEAASSARRP